jgi:hypothetical protein
VALTSVASGGWRGAEAVDGCQLQNAAPAFSQDSHGRLQRCFSTGAVLCLSHRSGPAGLEGHTVLIPSVTGSPEKDEEWGVQAVRLDLSCRLRPQHSLSGKHIPRAGHGTREVLALPVQRQVRVVESGAHQLQGSSGLLLKDSTLYGKPVLKHSTCEVPWCTSTSQPRFCPPDGTS